VSQWNSGKIYLYRNESKKSCKISDFDVKNYHLSYRENLFKSWAASLAAEIVIKTRCAGSFGECWSLMNGFLDGLELSDEDEGRKGLIRFLWRYLGLLGVRPDAGNCILCGEPFFTGITEKNRVLYTNAVAAFSVTENGFLCSDCLAGSLVPTAVSCSGSDILHIGTEAAQYLWAITYLEPKAVRKISIGTDSYNEIKKLVFTLIENAVGTKLISIQSGMGIL
jgi:DNA repair protein RecO (recombination protein O)